MTLPPQRKRPWPSHTLGSAAGSDSVLQPVSPTSPAAGQLHKHKPNIIIIDCDTIIRTPHQCCHFLVFHHLTDHAAP